MCGIQNGGHRMTLRACVCVQVVLRNVSPLNLLRNFPEQNSLVTSQKDINLKHMH